MKYFKVEFTVKPNGEVVEKVVQGDGGACVDLTKKIEDDLGGDSSTELLPEYYHGSDDNTQFLTTKL